MNIFASPGDTVRYGKPNAGHARDQEAANELLVTGKPYTVERVVVHSCRTEVYLEGFRQPFNSVLLVDDKVDEIRAKARSKMYYALGLHGSFDTQMHDKQLSKSIYMVRAAAEYLVEGEVDSDMFTIVVMLMASLRAGTNLDMLAAFTEIDSEVLRPYHKRAYDQRIFIDGMVDGESWLDDEDGVLHIRLDSMVVAGILDRAQPEDDDEYPHD